MGGFGYSRKPLIVEPQLGCTVVSRNQRQALRVLTLSGTI
jgi:hypothetical protein